MTTNDLVQRCLQVMTSKPHELLRGILLPSPLVQAGRFLDTMPDLRQEFERGATLYRLRQLDQAIEAFLALERAAEARARHAGRTSALNAATCAVAAGRHDLAVQLLRPRYAAGGLFGLPLWNYAVALYRLGAFGEALEAVEAWLPKATNEWFRGRGLLAASALAVLADSPERAREHLASALSTHQEMVLRKVGVAAGATPASTRGITAEQVGLAAWQRDGLLQILRPRRPERHPALISELT